MVLTGASSGIGLATARAAAAKGARVFLIARNESVLREVCAEISTAGGQADYFPADVGDEMELRLAAREALSRFGRVDTWVNIAGVAIYAPLLETPRTEHERLFRTNYWGVVNGCTAAVPLLRQNGGALITVGSVVSDIGTPLLGAYAASKHAAKGFVDSLRIELLAQRAPISVTLIKPAGIGSPLAEHAANHLGHAAKVPPPAYTPEAVATAILDAAVHRRREVVVGGVGALQLLGHALAPSLVDRVSTWMIPLLGDRRRSAPARSNLFADGDDGRVRSPHEPMLPVSLYTAAMRHPGWMIGGVIAAGLATRLVSRRRRTS